MTLGMAEQTTEELLELVADGLATDSVRLGAACELIARLYAKESK